MSSLTMNYCHQYAKSSEMTRPYTSIDNFYEICQFMGDFVLRCIVFTTNSAIHRRVIFILSFFKKRNRLSGLTTERNLKTTTNVLKWKITEKNHQRRTNNTIMHLNMRLNPLDYANNHNKVWKRQRNVP